MTYLSLVGRAEDTLDRFFALAQRPAWRDSWSLALHTESREQAQLIWTELTAETWKVVQSLTLPHRRELLFSRVVYEAAHLEPALVFFPPEAAEQLSFSWEDGGPPDWVRAIADGGVVQWYLAEEFAGSYLALWCRAGLQGTWRRTLHLASYPGQLWSWNAYEDLEQGGYWPAPYLARCNGNHALTPP